MMKDNLGNGHLSLSAEKERMQKRMQKRDGECDAAIGVSPLSTDPDYLDGYLSEMRQRIEAGNCKLEIIWRLIPTQN